MRVKMADAREVADVGMRPHTELLHLGILRPVVLRPLVPRLGDVLKAGVVHLRCVRQRTGHRSPQLFEPVSYHLGPL